ncbi:hypothetical protein [Mycoplasma sp. ATU-Cv-508]|uniref:hypothetical protein n=1 Tax=Mycoplasma sp. ATU-Cv-508 TaxID=2048001 RepID=UPI000FDD13A6
MSGDLKMRVLAELIKNVEFESVQDLTVKQWVQKRINRKIHLKLNYIYKNKIYFRVIQNKKVLGTKFSVRLRWEEI